MLNQRFSCSNLLLNHIQILNNFLLDTAYLLMLNVLNYKDFYLQMKERIKFLLNLTFDSIPHLW